jgi:phosphoglycolate phosphatase
MRHQLRSAKGHTGILSKNEALLTKLVVFDLDGTLVDSSRDLADSTNAMLESYGAAALPLDRVILMVGEGARILVERALVAAGVIVDLDDALGRFQEAYRSRLLATTRPYPGISAMLERVAPDAALAVLTNKPLAPSTRLIEALGWSTTFFRIIGGDDEVPRKPDPSGLRLLMALAGTGPESTMMVGDSMVDVETARRAGAAICVARYGFGSARGDLVLQGDAWIAATGHEVEGAIRDWSQR